MMQVDLQSLVDEIAQDMAQETERGKVADYIPSLACVSPEKFGITIIDYEGNCFTAGDAETPFSVQSISKVFSLTMALGSVGDAIWARVGREPSGSPFNSIVQLESERGIPRNPFINPGAIVVSDVLLASYRPSEILGEFIRFMQMASGDDTIYIDKNVARNEQETGFRKAGRYLMCGGRLHAQTTDSIISRQRTRRILALMMMCGHYDGSGEFAYRVGLPGKSGVGGGILAIAPGLASIAVWSPGLNNHGNSPNLLTVSFSIAVNIKLKMTRCQN